MNLYVVLIMSKDAHENCQRKKRQIRRKVLVVVKTNLILFQKKKQKNAENTQGKRTRIKNFHSSLHFAGLRAAPRLLCNLNLKHGVCNVCVCGTCVRVQEYSCIKPIYTWTVTDAENEENRIETHAHNKRLSSHSLWHA